MSVEVEDQCISEWLESEENAKDCSERSEIRYLRAYLLSSIDSDICKELPGGFELSILKQVKFSYTRDFLLSFGNLKICKRLPSGMDPSILREFGDAFDCTLDNQRTHGSMSLYNSRISEKESSQYLKLDSHNNSQGLCGRSDRYTLGLNSRDRHSHSDFGRYGNSSQQSWKISESDGLFGTGALPRVSGCTAKVLTTNIQEDSHCQLNKSDNPYRPPHSYKSGNIKYAAETVSVNIDISANMGDDEREKQTGNHTVPVDQQDKSSSINARIISKHDMIENLPSVEQDFDTGIVVPSYEASNDSETCTTLEEENVDNMKQSMVIDVSGQEHLALIPKEHFNSASKVDNDCSSTLIVKRAPQYLAIFSEGILEYSDQVCSSKVEADSIVGDISTMENNRNSKENQISGPNFGMDFMKKIHSTQASFSVQRQEVDRITSIDNCKPCEFPFSCSDDRFLMSILYECGAMEKNVGIVSRYTTEIQRDRIKGTGSEFNDTWSEISSILQMEQELEFNPVADSSNIDDSRVGIYLPEKDNPISVDYLKVAENSKYLPQIASVVPVEKSNPSTTAGYEEADDLETEICLPDEDSLIIIDDLVAPQCLKSMSGRELVKTNMLASGSDVIIDVADEFAALGVAYHNERSALPCIKGSPILDAMYAKGPHHNLHELQTYPESRETRKNIEKSSLLSLDSYQALVNSQNKYMDPKQIHHNLPLNSYPSTNIPPRPSWKTPAKLKEFHHLAQYSLPTSFPKQQNQLLSGTTLPDPLKRMAYHSQDVNPIHNCPLNAFHGFGMANLDPGGARGYNDAAAFNSFIDAERGARVLHSFGVPVDARMSYCKNLGAGFGYGR